MQHLVIATLASAAPMGAQVYENEVTRRAARSLSELGERWDVDAVVARSLRSPLSGDRRVPLGLLDRGGPALRRVAGRLIYPAGALVHRMGLTLPPAPREVVTLHDTVAWRYPDEGTAPRSAGAELRAARAVICVSRFAADQIAERFGVVPHVVHNGVDPRFAVASPLTEADRRELGIPRRYVLHAGGASERKNLPALASAWQEISRAHPDVSLVLCGPEHPRRTALFQSLPRTVLAGRVRDDLMAGVVAGAEVVVVPSLDEGFGLPVLEGMAAGVPVVAADTSAIPEAAGGAAVLVPPTGPGIAESVVAVLDGDIDTDALVVRGRARAAEFTWERCVAEHAAIWRRAAL